MTFIPPPIPLSRKEFAQRRAKLLAEGKPVTMRNIDPHFYEWLEKRRRSRAIRDTILAVAVLFLSLTFIVTVAYKAIRHPVGSPAFRQPVEVNVYPAPAGREGR